MGKLAHDMEHYSISEVLRDKNIKAMDIDELKHAWRNHHNLSLNAMSAFWESTVRHCLIIGDIVYHSTYRNSKGKLQAHGFGLL